MLDYLFDLSAVPQLVIFLIYGAALYGTGSLFLGFFHPRFVKRPLLLPATPASQALTVLFALLVSFLGADIWSQQRQAVDAALKEEISLQRLYDLADPAALNEPAARPMLAQYRKAVVEKEWGIRLNRSADPSVAASLLTIRLLGLKMAQAQKPAVLTAEWVRSANELAEARERRLLIGSDSTDNSQWSVVLVLAFFTVVALAACHMDRPPAGRLALFLFAMAVSVVLWQLARHTNPYNGGDLEIHAPRSPA